MNRKFLQHYLPGIIIVALLLGISGPPRKNVKNAKTVCATTATPLTAQIMHSFCVRSKSGAADVFLGDEDVTILNGFPIFAKDAYCDEVRDTAEMFCIVAAGTEDVFVIGSN